MLLEKMDERKERIRVLKLLKHELEVNLVRLLPVIRENVQRISVPYAPLSFAIWDALSDKVALIESDEAFGVITNAYYNLRTLDKALDRFQDIAHKYLSASDWSAKYELSKRVQSTRDTILAHIREPENKDDRTLVLIIKEAMTAIEKELHRLDC